MKPMIFIPTEEQKELAESLCNQIIDLLGPCPVEMKAFVLQNLIESFEEISLIDLRHGISIREQSPIVRKKLPTPNGAVYIVDYPGGKVNIEAKNAKEALRKAKKQLTTTVKKITRRAEVKK